MRGGAPAWSLHRSPRRRRAPYGPSPGQSPAWSAAAARAGDGLIWSGRGAKPVDFLAVERRGVVEDVGGEGDLVVAEAFQIVAPPGTDARVDRSDAGEERLGVRHDVDAAAVGLIARARGEAGLLQPVD